MLGTLVFFFGGDKTNATPTTKTTPEIQVTDTPIKYKTVSIEDVNIGERLLGKNPIQDEVDDFVPDIIPNQDGFNTLMLTFTEGKNKIFFDSAKTQFQFFQYVYHRRACSFDELRKQVWKSETKDSNIISCAKRVNQKIECAGLLDRYDLQTKNGHVVLNGPG